MIHGHDSAMIETTGKIDLKTDLSRQAWLQEPGLVRILDVIGKAGFEARPVGGAVRDALLGRKVAEIDIAVNCEPQKIIDILSAAKIKTVPTGFEHGTVTAVIDHRGYELTSLRRDIETDGRRAKVIFTEDWQEDASRRDFTFNALYIDVQGNLVDYFGGQKDLAQGRVRFIGDAHERIKEDVLRILRFFRFYAWFGRGAIDPTGLEACAHMASLLPQLSIERVWREISKLLAAKNPLAAWQAMLDHAILAKLLPEANDVKRLQNLIEIEAKYEAEPAYLARLAALLPKDKELALKISQRLKISNREAEHLQALATLPDQLRGKLDPVPFRRMLYEHGSAFMRDALLLHAADHPASDIEETLALAAAWQRPQLPLQGEDIVNLGIKPGPRIGEILRTVEEWWIAQDFHADRASCLRMAVDLMRAGNNKT